MDIETFNSESPSSLRALLTPCVDIPSWVEGLIDGRPYSDTDDLLGRADRLTAAWSREEVVHALDAHPRIGERPTTVGRGAAMSTREQAGVGEDDVLRARLHAGNVAYEERFGRVFLVRAAGRTGEQMLEALTERLGHDPDTELEVTTGQLREITLLRLAGVLAA